MRAHAKFSFLRYLLAALIEKYNKELIALDVLELNRSTHQSLIITVQNSEESDEERHIRLGASELPLALGRSDYGSASDVVAGKFTKRQPTAAMQRGHAQEESAADLYKTVMKVRAYLGVAARAAA